MKHCCLLYEKLLYYVLDIDECETGTHKCTENQQCINRQGHYICQCPPGHKAISPDKCEDINECDYFRGHSVCILSLSFLS